MKDQPANAAPTPDKKPPPANDANPSSISEAASPGETMDFRAPGAPSKAFAATPPGAPAAFGRYVVKKVLGSGAFGTVYLGHDPQLDRPVAIKAHRPDRAMAHDHLQSFKQEARRIAKLRHPGIVTVHDFDIQGELVYIVADFVEGITLRDRIKSQAFTWQDSVRIVAALADAIAHAHAQRIIHRDIKPANIILAPDMKPVLVDFGLGLDDSELRGDQRGMVAGTPAYMSPEQTAGQGHRIDGRTDIYSLGVVLYEMITGHVPFRAPAHDELVRQICDDEPQPPRQLVPHLPRPLEQICLKALAKRINDRFTTAGDMAEELTKLLGGAVKHADDEAPSIAMPSQAVGAPTLTYEDPKPPAAADSSKSSAKSSTTRPREAERRQLTLLSCHCDLFESTAFIENLDYEEQHEVLRAYQDLCDSAIKRMGGTALQLTEQSVLACFGYPVAYEDAAARAIRAGLDILKDAAGLREQLQRSKGLGFTLSATIHTGMAVASDAPEGAGREAFSIVGEARNVIARLDSVARPDAVVISQTTYRLVQGFFLCESLGNTAIKGVPRPLEFFKVVRASDVQSRIDVAGATGLTPLIGRDREVGLLQDRWEQAVEGMGQVVLLIGEAGLGKSRLIHVIKEHVRAQAAAEAKPIVEWRCTPHHQNSSLYPVIDFFERTLRFERDDAPEQKFAKLQAQMERLGLANDDVLPYLASLLSLPLGERYPEFQLAPARLKEKTLDALMECLRVLGIQQPFLFIIEDLHWVDPSTLELLAMHVESGLNDRILTVMTFRPEFETPWKSKAHQTVMALNRLTKRQIADMMAQKTGVKKLPPALVEQIVAKTDGVPLFVEEYTSMMIEAGKLRENEGQIEVAGSFLGQEIPATLQDLLMARLDRMASNREVVQIGATIGREFTYDLLRAVTPGDEHELQTELDKLVSAELLFQKGKPPLSSYQFKHALIQDAAYQSLLKSKKQQVHRRVAVALEKQFAEMVQNQPEMLAHHFTEAGLVPQAIEYWRKAGLRSQERSANAEAVSHFRRGLELLSTLPDTPERAGQELAMQIPLGTGLIALRGYAAPEVGPIFARARELCVKIGEPQSLMAVLWGIWAWRVVREEFDQCLELAKEMLALAKTHADDGMLMEAHFVPGLTLFYRGEFTKAQEHLRAGLVLYDEKRCQAWSRHTGQNSGVTLRSYLALSQWCLGFPDQALRTAQDAVKLARALNHPYSLCYALHHLGWLQQHLRSETGVQTSAEAELVVAGEHGFTFWKAVGTLCRAAGLLLQRKPAAALEQAKQGLTVFNATGAALSLGHYLAYFAEAHRQLGQLGEAASLIDQAIAAALKNHNHFFLAELHRLKGEILLAQSGADQVAAEACFQDALAVAHKQQAKSWELRITMSLCKLWQQQGRQAEARARLASVHQWFAEGFPTPDLVDAKKLLDAWA
jgi:TOMM system kinase/cyclase fusion protein